MSGLNVSTEEVQAKCLKNTPGYIFGEKKKKGENNNLKRYMCLKFPTALFVITKI